MGTSGRYITNKSVIQSSPSGGGYGRAIGILAGSGKQQKADIEQRYKAMANAGAQDLVSRGLAGTTIMPTMRMGYAREMEAAMGRVNDSISQQMAGLYAQEAQANLQRELAGQQLALQYAQLNRNSMSRGGYGYPARRGGISGAVRSPASALGPLPGSYGSYQSRYA